MARPLRDRLKFDLERNRKELVQVVSLIEDVSYAPAPGMKTYEAQLREIGAMEAESVYLLDNWSSAPLERDRGEDYGNHPCQNF